MKAEERRKTGKEEKENTGMTQGAFFFLFWHTMRTINESNKHRYAMRRRMDWNWEYEQKLVVRDTHMA